MGGGAFKSVARLTAKERGELKASLHHSKQTRKFGGSKEHVKRSNHYATRPDDRNDEIMANHRGAREFLTALSGRDMSKRPTRAIEDIPTKDKSYANVHPSRWGSAKGGRTYVVGGQTASAPNVREHELLHSEGRSSWRMAQIQSDPAKAAREEARADTVSGTFKNKYKARNLKSHSEAHRNTARKERSTKFVAGRLERSAKKAGPYSIRGGVQEATAANMRSSLKNSKEFTRVQDKISDKPKAFFTAKQRKKTAVRAGVATGTTAGLGAYAHRKYQRDNNGRFS